MGYSTDFVGGFKFNKPLTAPQVAYLKKFNETRRVKRNPLTAERLGDPIREAVGLPVGDSGGYFTGGLGDFGQDHDGSILDGNSPPVGQPGLWCQWTPSDDGTVLSWDGGEKFYNYVEWLKYIIEHFLTPWGVTITGVVRWRGEEFSDTGSIVVTDNVVDVQDGEKKPIPRGMPKRDTVLGWSEPAKPARA